MCCSKSKVDEQVVRDGSASILILTGSLRSPTLASFADGLRSPTITSFADGFTRATNDESHKSLPPGYLVIRACLNQKPLDFKCSFTPRRVIFKQTVGKANRVR